MPSKSPSCVSEAGSGLGDRNVAQARRRLVDQGPAAGGKDDDVAAGPLADADVDQLRQPVEGLVAAVLQIGDALSGRRIADDLVVEVGDGREAPVDFFDGAR